MKQIKELAACARISIIPNNISMSVQSKMEKLTFETCSGESTSRPDQFQIYH